MVDLLTTPFLDPLERLTRGGRPWPDKDELGVKITNSWRGYSRLLPARCARQELRELGLSLTS